MFQFFLGRFPQNYTYWIQYIKREEDKVHFPTGEELDPLK